jgi:hypothetical protein
MIVHHYHCMKYGEPGFTRSDDREDLVPFLMTQRGLPVVKPPSEEDGSPWPLLMRHLSALREWKHPTQ